MPLMTPIYHGYWQSLIELSNAGLKRKGQAGAL